MIISNHARDEMNQSDISEEEVKACFENGELVIKQVVNGKIRYGKQIAFKEKTIIIIYTFQNQEERIITAYPVRRKKQW